MNLKIFFLLIIYFLVHDTTAEDHRLDTYDINSIQIFINNVHERARSYYRLENTTLEDYEKNNILKMIFNDLTIILTELNKMSNDSRKILSSGDLISFVASLEKHDLENGYSVQPKLSVELNTIFNMSETINSYAEPLLKLGSSNFSAERDMSEFCPSNKSIQPNIEFKFEQPIVLNEYMKFINNLTIIMYNKKRYNFCGQTSSLNQAIFDYHHQVIATYLKEYIMLNFVDIIDGRCFDWNVTPLSSTRRNNSMKEISEIIKLTKELLDHASLLIYRCDADYSNNTNGKSYYELEHMIQTVIVPEKELSTTGSCSHNCDLNAIRHSINNNDCDEYQHCQYLDSSYEICESTDKTSSRRYEWFRSRSGAPYGRNFPSCSGPVKTLSSSYNAFPPRWCDYCMCTCAQKSRRKHVIAAVSFREQVTDIDNNMVVVGVRFIEKGKLIHVQIKERKLKPISSDDRGSWKELEDIYQSDNTGKFVIKNENSSIVELKPIVDYGEAKLMDCNDFIAPTGYVVTGVKLGFSRLFLNTLSVNTESIQLRVRVTPFDYNKGILINKNQTHWINDSNWFLRRQLFIRNPDLPTKSPKNVIDSNPNEFVRFRVSDLRKDGGQSTIPFFDAQNVEGAPEFPLGGVGVVHRGHEGYGGFVALRIHDLKLYNYFNDEIQKQS
ncbi:uncharacterized protein LOC130672449 [Microplitis mediator]|uniref:uncharacterized protein LOC130672449 n=1 Tax=Microplitis mediator TaxID=375433 RepID=UPI0025563C19|nr:uncharacterized protein LOC130672449 [Microplitis mediator]